MDSSDIFHSQENYFRSILDLFDEFQWLVKYPVTEILIHNSLDSIPHDWLVILRGLSNYELNQFVMGRLIRSDWPHTLLYLLERCRKLNRLSHISSENQEPKSLRSLPFKLYHGLSLKKQHEVSHLVDFIHRKCEEENIRTIVDFGSGLGYICQALNHLYGYRVFGLESNQKIYANACARQLKLFPESCNDVKYLCREVNFEDIDDINFIEDIIKYPDNNENSKICLIGLHSCGDLGLTSASAFQRIRQSKLLIMISCCYHKLQISENNEIIRFGMSSSLRKAMINYDEEKKLHLNYDDESHVRNIFNRPFMRLACQEPAARWEEWTDYDHRQHAFCVLSRAVLELFVFKNNIVLKKCVKKATRKSQCINFDTYLTDALERYTFNDQNESKNVELVDRIKKMWEDHEEKLQEIEIFTALQLLLQAPAESLVLEDRRFSLLESSTCENTNIEAEITPVFDCKISPRCQAIIARIKE